MKILPVRFLSSLAVLAFLTSSLGCSSAPPASSCTPGESNSCTCTNGDAGAQECGADGTFEACVCDDGGSGGQGNGSGGSGSGTGGGANGSGSASSSGGSGSGSGSSSSTGGGGSGDCELTTPACSLVVVESPDTISMKDEQSHRSIAGHWCTQNGTATFVSEEICPYSEECDLTTSTCTACGDAGRQTAKRLTNGTVTEECEGCSCFYWRVHGCVADTTEYGEPYAIISFQADADVFQYYVTPSGQAHTPLQNATVAASNVSASITPNGMVELDAVVDYAYTEGETWHLEGHVVGTCPE